MTRGGGCAAREQGARGDAARVAIVGLGSNVGDRLGWLAEAAGRVARLPGVHVEAASPAYETAPVGGPPQGDFVNAALRLRTALTPRELLAALLDVERSLGRTRRVRWGPRTIDLDLLHVDGVALADAQLELPHPRLLDRAFALGPLLDVWPDAPPAWGARLLALGGRPDRVARDARWAAASLVRGAPERAAP